MVRVARDPDLARLIAELRASTEGASGSAVRPGVLLVPLRYTIGDHRFELFTTIATIDTPLDVTVSELRIETFWPADAVSDAEWKSFVAEGP